MAAVTFNHRVGFPDPNVAQGAADLTDAIAFVRGRAAEFGIDPERVGLAAYSAGGPLLAAPIREPKPYVRCLVAFYSFLDLRPSALHRKFLSEEQVRQFSPAVALTESTGKLPPIFVARAGKDQIPDLLPGLDRFVAEALARKYHDPGSAAPDTRPSSSPRTPRAASRLPTRFTTASAFIGCRRGCFRRSPRSRWVCHGPGW
jgi:acetyl esterase/lipase